ncbi:facilitated trehalose transporter Tret1-like [Galleria mellonella]|uniref:Facilitated trehalose transporter Tret1-like n=1 Tax=Galleria mellonella TaxID=7137 RepID=A0ABM3N7D5_GALME|nr:facilitated trehalose transporter Tret1-like [Galleria mellonella]
MEHGNRKVQYIVTLAVSLAAVTTGVCLTWTTAVIPKFYNNETNIHITDAGISWMAAISSPGFVVGSVASRFVSDKFGRRATLLSSALPVTVGSIATLSGSHIWILCAARFLWGIGTGMISTVSSIYLAEIADKDIRGSLIVANRFFVNFGIFLVLVIGPFVSYNTINYMILALPICYFVSCWLIPETPYYYLKEEKVDKARHVLKKLRGIKNEKVLEDELSTMRSNVGKDMRRSGTVKELFSGKQYRKALFIIAGLKIGQMMTGCIVIQHYLGRIMQDSRSNMNLATVFVVFGALRFTVGVMSSVIADKVGRRTLFIYSFLGTGLSLSLIAAYFCCQEVIKIEQSQLASYAIVVFIGIILSNIISTLGYNSIIYAVQGEIFPLNVKSLAMTCLNIFGGTLNFLVTKTYQTLKDVSGTFGVFLLFTIMSFGSFVFVYFFVPETKGKSLSEIQKILQGKYYDDDSIQVNKNLNDVKDGTELKLLENKDR